jgi:MFS superfamily sulfate permease-like transporter
LGVLLILQGIKAGGEWYMFEGQSGAIILGAAALMVILPEVGEIPLLGLIATVGVLFAVFWPVQSATVMVEAKTNNSLSWSLIFGLLLPQIALTSANSVLATSNVCEQYFGKNAMRVNARNLLYSIGFGNVLASLVGGLPFCHGSGGVTAHFRGGSTSAWSTVFMGLFLIILSAVQFYYHQTTIIIPALLAAPLLIAIGFFHFKLAASSTKNRIGQFKFVLAILVTVVTKNLLWVLGIAIILELAFFYFKGLNFNFLTRRQKNDSI